MAESHEPESAQTLDTPSAHDADALSSDVMDIVASLEAGAVEATPPEAADETPSAAATAQASGPTDSPPAALDPGSAQAPAAAGDVAVAAEGPQVRRAVAPWWPFLVYLAAWAIVSAVAGWLLLQTPDGEAVYATVLYESVIRMELVFTAAGPCLIALVWLAAAIRARGSSRAGLFTGSLLRGAIATFAGVLTWWGMLVLVDTLRLGKAL